MSFMHRIGRRALDLLLPPQCLACSAPIAEPGRLCGDCFGATTFVTEPLCACCGLPFEFEVEPGRICALCAAVPPTWDHVRAAAHYADPLRSALLSYKHADRTDMAAGLATLLQRAGSELLSAADIIAPVPLHPRRLWTRRYNQSQLLAALLAEQNRLTNVPDLLTRKRPTPSQGGLSPTARRRNVRGAFAVTEAHRDGVEGRHVLLIDDVFTTGATIEACARVLKRGGAETVSALVVARVVRSGRVN